MAEQTWSYDESVRAGLEKLIAENDLTHAEVALRVGVTPTRVTKFLNLNAPGRVPERDMPEVQAAVKNFLRHISRRAALRESLFENSVTKSVFSVMRTVRRTGDVALLHSVGGVGKSSAAELFHRDNINTIFITARQYACGARAIETMLFEEVCEKAVAKYPGNMRRALWMEAQLRGSECLIIVDNAQRLDITAFKWIMDFHDASLCPVCFLGNSEVLDTLRRRDHEGQLITRVGIVQKVRLKDDAEDTARKLIGQFAPRSGNELVDASVDVLGKCGNARTLKKQLVLTAAIFDGMRDKDWTRAFDSAGTQLLKPTARRNED